MNCSKPKLVIALLPPFLMTSVVLALAAGLVGCQDDQDIRVYNVPPMADTKQPASTPTQNTRGIPAGKPQVRMVGAILPRTDRVWFFKAMGAEELIHPQIDAIQTFIKSVRFVANVSGDDRQPKEIPQWTLPEGWSTAGPNGMRYDTITIGNAAHNIELTVTPLGPLSGDLKANVARWAGQVGHANPSNEVIASFSEPITVAGAAGHFVNIPGPGGGSSDMANRQPPRNTNPNTSRPTGPPMKVNYKTPAGWTEQQAGGMRMAAFTITDGTTSAEMTVIPLPMAAAEAASPIANINRWRGQVNLPPLTQPEILADLEADEAGKPTKHVRIVNIGGQQALLTDMTAPESASPRERIIGVLHPMSEVGYIYFYKMKGPADLVGANKDKFLALIQSVTYEP